MNYPYDQEEVSYELISIQEIAERLDMSTTTVSRALSGKGRISQATVDKVNEFLEYNKYVPHVSRRSDKKTHSICVVLPGEEGYAELPFFQEILLYIYDYFTPKDYGVMIAKATSSDISALKMLVTKHKVDGVILTRAMEDDLSISYLQRERIPFVVAGSWPDERVVQVDFDQKGGCRDLTSLLFRMNIRNIAFACGNKGHVVTQSRLKGIEEAYKDVGLVMEQGMIYEGALYPPIVESIVLKLMEKKVECILCLDDNICLNVLNVLQKKNIRVPDEVKIASCYSSRLLSGYHPSITCLEFDVKEMGILAGKKLIDAINGKTDHSKMVLGYNILVKDSTK